MNGIIDEIFFKDIIISGLYLIPFLRAFTLFNEFLVSVSIQTQDLFNE